MHFRLVGHRGAGANGPIPVRPVQLMENTIASFNEAVKLGASMVEFDVQLTKDLKPVIFHDFFVCSQENHYQVSLLDYQELVDLVLNGAQPAQPQKNTFFDGKACKKCKKREQDYKLVNDDIPLLEETFKNTLPVGFNIEIKYPTQDEIEEYHLLTPIGIDQYCRTIVDSIGEGRNVVISSFHPGVCLWIKRNTSYEVMFLTDAGEQVSKYDPRLSSLQAAFAFAKESQFDGIVANAAGLLKSDIELVAEITSCMLLYSYGVENCYPNEAKKQLDLKVSGIITDDIAAIRPLANCSCKSEL